eukprot:scaffold10478_cov114-Isochrysis_galbana.AAC.2
MSSPNDSCSPATAGKGMQPETPKLEAPLTSSARRESWRLSASLWPSAARSTHTRAIYRALSQKIVWWRDRTPRSSLMHWAGGAF